MKGKIYNMVVGPAMMYVLVSVALKTGNSTGGVRVEDVKIFHWK